MCKWLCTVQHCMLPSARLQRYASKCNIVCETHWRAHIGMWSTDCSAQRYVSMCSIAQVCQPMSTTTCLMPWSWGQAQVPLARPQPLTPLWPDGLSHLWKFLHLFQNWIKSHCCRRLMLSGGVEKSGQKYPKISRKDRINFIQVTLSITTSNTTTPTILLITLSALL